MGESPRAFASAEVMIYCDNRKIWVPPEGSNGAAASVQIMQNHAKQSFRIVGVSNPDGECVLNCNIHHRLKYHAATSTFHQWRDEKRQVYGLNFQSEAEAQQFAITMAQAIDYLNGQMVNMQNDYQSIPNHDNVYQDPHQHLPQNHSAPAFRDNDDQSGLHPNFRKSSQGQGLAQNNSMNMLTQQQRRASQGSSNSSNGHGSMYSQQPAASSSPSRVAPGPPPAPPSGGPPPAPPPPPASFSVQSTPAPTSAPPAAPPPPPAGLMAAKSSTGLSFADQIKAASQSQLKKTNGIAGKESRSQSLAENTGPASSSNGGGPAPRSGDLFSELAATINKRKMTQAKADAADSKSNISNGSSSSDSGVSHTPPSTIAAPTFANGGGGVKKWEPVKTNGHSATTSTDSPKTHRKVPSGSSISSQEDCMPKMNGTGNGSSNGSSVAMTPEFLERFKADLMVEVRLEINKAKQEIIDVLREELSRR